MGRKKKGKEKLSLIVPSYKQERTIVRNIKRLSTVVSQLKIPFEIIVVIDGGNDNTYKKLKENKISRLKIFQFKKNQGKGYAIRYGGKMAEGDIIGFMDAGLDIDPTGISMLLNHMKWYKADIIVGSKMHPVSQVDYPFYRKVLSWGYRTFTRVLFGFKVRDTQAGAKLFRKKVVKDVFPRLLVKTFAFDVEVLALSYALGYKRIYEAPIKLNFNKNTTLNSTALIKTIFLMLWDTCAVFYRVRIIKYYRKSNKRNWLN